VWCLVCWNKHKDRTSTKDQETHEANRASDELPAKFDFSFESLIGRGVCGSQVYGPWFCTRCGASTIETWSGPEPVPQTPPKRCSTCRTEGTVVPASKAPETVDVWEVTLDRYQRDNLLWLLRLCGAHEIPVEPFHLADTGVWLSQIADMLDDGREERPTSSTEQLEKMLDAWRRGQIGLHDDDRNDLSTLSGALRAGLADGRVCPSPNDDGVLTHAFWLGKFVAGLGKTQHNRAWFSEQASHRARRLANSLCKRWRCWACNAEMVTESTPTACSSCGATAGFDRRD
jgi:hypothetical protein